MKRGDYVWIVVQVPKDDPGNIIAEAYATEKAAHVGLNDFPARSRCGKLEHVRTHMACQDYADDKYHYCVSREEVGFVEEKHD